MRAPRTVLPRLPHLSSLLGLAIALTAPPAAAHLPSCTPGPTAAPTVAPTAALAWQPAQDPAAQAQAPQLGDRVADGLSREQMWRAPNASDWAKPNLIPWQRSWKDALSVMQETGKPILVCVNMDGEIASEHYAGVRYREPGVAAAYAPYITVIASVYRHTPRDWDPQGRRVECPRFGGVTCGEHIAMEVELYQKFFDGTRVAPRHIMIEDDGGETYDLYYANDTSTVFQQISDGILQREKKPNDPPPGDRSILERVASRDNVDRIAVEQAYASGSVEMREGLLKAAIQHGDAEQLGLLRLAVFDLDLNLNKLAREALAKTDSNRAVSLIGEALRVPMADGERKGLIDALGRLGKTNSAAKTLSMVHTGLASTNSKVDASAWSEALVGAEYPAPKDWSGLEQSLDHKERLTADEPADPETQLELAEAALAFAVDPNTARILAADPATAQRYSRLHFEDARQAVEVARKLGASGWRMDAVQCLSNYYLGDTEQSAKFAEAAAAAIPAGDTSWNAMAVLDIYAKNKRKTIEAAMQAKRDWPPLWLSELHNAYSILAKHPLGTGDQALSHYDFLTKVGAAGKATSALQNGIQRFPEHYQLHDRLRARVFHDRGIAGLERVYERLLAAENANPILNWYAGLASIVCAESYRRANQPKLAGPAYERALQYYQRSVELLPDTALTSAHYTAITLAGQARLAYERGDWDSALEKTLASFEHNPDAAASLDGLNHSAVTSAILLKARLVELERNDDANRLQAAMDLLDPEMLLPPEFDRVGPKWEQWRKEQEAKQNR
jgi:hypothetical protein